MSNEMTDRLLCRTVAMHTLSLLPAPIKHFVCLAYVYVTLGVGFGERFGI